MIIKTFKRQTIFDLAICYYGTLAGVWKILEDNSDLKFDTEFVEIGIAENNFYTPEGCVDFSMPLIENQNVEIDQDWEQRDNSVLKLLNKYISHTA